ncbi:ABC transporter ATP-binding protein [Candidatus Bathyarchaeota archaeon]|nr:ABC transporter ATP-binding protein [Candidatus Bathyarchaeota archaeon]
MPRIVLKEISKRYGKMTVLDDINLEIENGEFCVIVGPSGSGKTTLLNIIAGFVKCDKGEVIVDGESINHLSPRERNIGMVFQEIGLFSHMSVRENIAFGLEVKKMPREQIRRKVEEIAEKLRIAHLLDRKPATLSGGEAQRVAIARALITEPSFFLLDEPLGNLDAHLRSEMMAEIKRLHLSLKKTFIYVTHDQEQALAAADSVVIMNKGKVLQKGPPEMVYEHPANKFIAEFFGIMPMNLIDGEIVTTRDNNIIFKCGTLLFHLRNIGKQPSKTSATLGVRPENVTIVDTGPGDGSGKVMSVEVLGDKNLIYLDIDYAYPLVVLVDSKIKPNLGERLNVKLKEGKAFLFDQESGERIHP